MATAVFVFTALPLHPNTPITTLTNPIHRQRPFLAFADISLHCYNTASPVPMAVHLASSCLTSALNRSVILHLPAPITHPVSAFHAHFPCSLNTASNCNPMCFVQEGQGRAVAAGEPAGEGGEGGAAGPKPAPTPRGLPPTPRKPAAPPKAPSAPTRGETHSLTFSYTHKKCVPKCSL